MHDYFQVFFFNPLFQVFSCISSFAGISVFTIANKIAVTCLRIRNKKVYSYYILHNFTMHVLLCTVFGLANPVSGSLSIQKSPSFACTVGYDFLPYLRSLVLLMAELRRSPVEVGS